MQLNLITLATVKTQLGLSLTTYDASITAMIPLVSNDVRRILNNNFDEYRTAIITSGSSSIYINDNQDYKILYSSKPVYYMGQVLYSPSLPDDTYITNFNPDTSVYTLSANATSSGEYVYPTVSTGMWSAISKMIFYKISKMTTGSASVELLKSVSYGNVSKTFADSEINKQYDYPQTFINELGVPFMVVG